MAFRSDRSCLSRTACPKRDGTSNGTSKIHLSVHAQLSVPQHGQAGQHTVTCLIRPLHTWDVVGFVDYRAGQPAFDVENRAALARGLPIVPLACWGEQRIGRPLRTCKCLYGNALPVPLAVTWPFLSALSRPVRCRGCADVCR